MRKSTWRIIAIVLVAVLSLGAISFGTGLIKVDDDKAYDQFGKKPNENNIYTVECMTLVDSNDGRGVTVDVDERTGAIKLNGKATEDIDHDVGAVDLKAGTYTFTAIDGAAKNSVYVTININGTEKEFDFTPGNTFEVNGDYTNCVITIYIKEGAELHNVSVLPVIVEGDEAQNFYK